MLNDILKKKSCFKLVCGAGNEDPIEIEKLVALYSKAGCTLFDLCAKPEIVKAAKRGLEFSKISNDRYLCVSVGIKGDPHINKANIDFDKCIKCGSCINNCLQKAIVCNDSFYNINSKRCIGCGKCLNVCPTKAIQMTSKSIDLEKVLPEIISLGIDCIELHAIGENEKEVDEMWSKINSFYDGLLSICIDRYKLGNEGLLKRVNRMLEQREPYTTIIQADGAPMSGGKDDYKTTLQAVATAEIFQNAQMPVFILLSGGTNSKTTELAKLCGINANGVTIGSFARKIVREYIDRDDFLNNEEIFNKAVVIAKSLVDKSLEYLA